MLIPLILLVALPKIAISIKKIEKSPREDELIGVVKSFSLYAF